MARMAIDDMFVRDPRIVKVQRAVRASTGAELTRHDVMGRLLCVFAIVYDRVDDVLSVDDIDIAAELDGFAEAMIVAGLASRDRRGVLIRGANKRLEYLRTRSDSGREGGRKSGETRRNRAKQTAKVTFEANEARPNPPDLVPDPVPDLVPDLPPAPVRERAASRVRSPAAQLQPGWIPDRSAANVEAEAAAKARGVSLRDELANLRDWAADSGKPGKDWNARWRRWIRTAKPAQRNGHSLTPLEAQLERIRMLEAEEAATPPPEGAS